MLHLDTPQTTAFTRARRFLVLAAALYLGSGIALA